MAMEDLLRLASKPGVQSTLILSKADGSIIRSTGLLATSSTPDSGLSEQETNNGTALNGNTGVTEAMSGSDIQTQAKSAEEIARVVFNFVEGANTFAESMDQADEIKLLRMRTKRNEIMIVPGEHSCIF